MERLVKSEQSLEYGQYKCSNVGYSVVTNVPQQCKRIIQGAVRAGGGYM